MTERPPPYVVLDERPSMHPHDGSPAAKVRLGGAFVDRPGCHGDGLFCVVKDEFAADGEVIRNLVRLSRHEVQALARFEESTRKGGGE